MAAPKTTSDTTVVGDFTYIFLNRPDSDDIDWIRFKDASHPERGIIRNRPSVEGPIAVQLFTNNSLKLYYTAQAEETPGKGCLKELRLDNADKAETDVTNGWKTNDEEFEYYVVENSRWVDGSSFLSVSTRKDGGDIIPILTWKNPGKTTFFFYAWRAANGSWNTTKLKLPTSN